VSYLLDPLEPRYYMSTFTSNFKIAADLITLSSTRTAAKIAPLSPAGNVIDLGQYGVSVEGKPNEPVDSIQFRVTVNNITNLHNEGQVPLTIAGDQLNASGERTFNPASLSGSGTITIVATKDGTQSAPFSFPFTVASGSDNVPPAWAYVPQTTSTVNVGPNQTVKSLSSTLLNTSKVHINLEAGTYNLAHLRTKASDVVIEGPAPIVSTFSFTDKFGKTHVWTVKTPRAWIRLDQSTSGYGCIALDQCQRWQLRNVGIINSGRETYAFSLGATSGVWFDGVSLQGGVGLALLQGAKHTRIESCYQPADQRPSGYWCYAGSTTSNDDLQVFNNVVCGTRNGNLHVLRLHHSWDVEIAGNYLQNPRPDPTINDWWAQALNLRDGGRMSVHDNVIDGTTQVGPLDLQGDWDKRLDGVTFKNNVFQDWMVLNSGLLNCTFDGDRIWGDRTGSNVGVHYPPDGSGRPHAQANFTGCTFNYVGTVNVYAITGDKGSVHASSCTFNGKPYSR
jgi:hypothetical protein